MSGPRRCWTAVGLSIMLGFRCSGQQAASWQQGLIGSKAGVVRAARRSWQPHLSLSVYLDRGADVLRVSGLQVVCSDVTFGFGPALGASFQLSLCACTHGCCCPVSSNLCIAECV